MVLEDILSVAVVQEGLRATVTWHRIAVDNKGHRGALFKTVVCSHHNDQLRHTRET